MISVVAMLLAVLQPDCDPAATQPDLNACASEEFEKADGGLNAQWRATLAEMQRRDREEEPDLGQSTHVSRLRDAQRAWLLFRDAHCLSAYPARIGAELAYTLGINCRTQMTIERTQQLEDLMREVP